MSPSRHVADWQSAFDYVTGARPCLQCVLWPWLCVGQVVVVWLRCGVKAALAPQQHQKPPPPSPSPITKRHLPTQQTTIKTKTSGEESEELHDPIQSEILDSVDSSRVVLWGTSFGGGHALTLAARLGHRVAAVVAQASFAFAVL